MSESAPEQPKPPGFRKRKPFAYAFALSAGLPFTAAVLMRLHEAFAAIAAPLALASVIVWVYFVLGGLVMLTRDESRGASYFLGGTAGAIIGVGVCTLAAYTAQVH